MAESPVTFAALLRSLRTEAGLTQEQLACAATISVRTVSDLERGINLTARRDTRKLLADALNLAGPAREEFEAVARGRMPGTPATP
jgi:transcriptional regulator with XRE-family HTH domain